MELVDVYDSQRRLTGKVVQRGSTGKDEYRLVVHICVFDSTGRMLIQKRSMNKSSLPGYWDISAGGQVDAGEDSPQGASRELGEELGIIRRFADDDRVCTVTFRYGFDDYYITGFTSSDSITLQESEVSEAGWATFEEIAAMIEDRSFIQYRPSFIRKLFDCYYRFVPVGDTDNDTAFDSFDRYIEKN